MLIVARDINLRFLRMAFVLGAIMASTSACHSMGEGCQFLYSEKIRDEVSIPILRAKFGDSYKYFDYKNPTVSRSGNVVKLIFDPTERVNGEMLMYENAFVIEVDACAEKVIRSYEARY